MKIATITDIHHGPRHHSKRGDAALDLLERFAAYVAAEKPDLVLEMGDRITDVDAETDQGLLREVAEALSTLDVPIYHVCGNHDRYHLSVAENAEILGQSLENKTIDLGTWAVALWRAEARITWNTPESRGFDLPETDLAWLHETVQGATKPMLVVSHVPVSGHSQIGNAYFENNPDLATYPQAAQVREVLAAAPMPVVCIAGHVHWNSVTQVRGVTHLTQQSLTESFTTGGEPAAAMGVLSLGRDVHWQVESRDPFELRFTPGTDRWCAPLAPFNGRPVRQATDQSTI